ncbi:MAG: GGDEF domain-containing protein [Oscillospiraceae bacterium]
MLNNIDLNEFTLAGLSEVYISLHIFDLEEDVFFPIKTNKYIEMWSEGFDGSREQLHNVMTMITAEEHRELILEFTDLTTLEERMNGHRVISAVFNGKVNGWCRARFIRVSGSNTDKLRYVLYAVECIDEEKKKENHLLYLSQTDLMTGIYNRGYGERMISELLDRQRQGLFCLFDVDKFKHINDKYGHNIGDKVLIEISKALQKVKRNNDIVMRLGGDEFAAYFLDIDSKSDASEIITMFFDEISKISIEPISEKISVSLGAVLYKNGFSFDSIYKLADNGVYDSKTNKGNSYTFFA